MVDIGLLAENGVIRNKLIVHDDHLRTREKRMFSATPLLDSGFFNRPRIAYRRPSTIDGA